MSQITDGLNPELIEVQFALAKLPAPRFIEAKEHAPPCSDKLLQDQRIANRQAGAAACVSGFGINSQYLCRTLGLVTLGMPKELLELIPNDLVFLLIGA